MRTAVRTWVVVLALVAGATAAAVSWAAPARAASPVRVQATIDGHPLTDAGAGNPLKLHPGHMANVALEVSNGGDQPVTVSSVDLTGRVIGLTFYSFQTSVSLTVPAGSTGNLNFLLDLRGLGGQATGLIPASLTLHDPNDRTISSQGMVSDVRGSIASVYGLFGLAVLVLTLLALGAAFLALARHRLPINRWMRGLRFLTPGIGIGLVLVFTLSALRVFVPRAATWIIILIISAAVFFVLGYLTPDPVDDDDNDDDDDDEGDGDTAGQPAQPAAAGARQTNVVPPESTAGWPGPPR